MTTHTPRPLNDVLRNIVLTDVERRLISAAPDMLAALKGAVAQADNNLSKFNGRTKDCEKTYKQCVDAIAKAEGQP